MRFKGLGVEYDQLRSSVNVYPNPTNSWFTLSINNIEVRDITLELFEISGHTNTILWTDPF